MDLRRLAKVFPINPSGDGNSTSSGTLNLTDIPPSILETLLPGYGPVARYIADTYGIDISVFVTAAVIIVAVVKGSQYVFSFLLSAFRNSFTSSIYIDEHDDLFDMVMSWVALQRGIAAQRAQRAKTPRGNSATETSPDDANADVLDDDGMFNYVKWNARSPPRFEPYYGRHMVWHKGRPVMFHCSQKSNNNRVQIQFGGPPEDDVIQLECIGRDTEPVKDLIKTVRTWSLNRSRGTTTIRHPVPKDRARFSGSWAKSFPRPSRPMDTVILDAVQKELVVKDMNEYLHPWSERWYATRGIPYRRGYLFFGPPGTGKTSLSFALAGIFGLEIYVISLQEPTLSEGDLLQLFNGLPRRCIVLLEDVDAAGLKRAGKSGERKKKATADKANGKVNGTTEKDPNNFTLRDLARELRSIGGGGKGNRDAEVVPNRAPGAGISLSGLLNAIDGVATQEGRVLIMTTNHPEKLDPALVRPGRIDMRIEFRHAMTEQIRELFMRMYAVSDDAQPPGMPTRQLAEPELKRERERERERERDLSTLANEFAARVPGDTFTPAEIQNLLMRHKKDPEVSVARAADWVRETLAEQRARKEEAEAQAASDGDDD